MNIYMIRHGETVYNQEMRIQGAGINSSLAPTGIEGAKNVGKKLSQIKFYQVYSSPMKRTMETTSYILEENKYWHHKTWQQEADFREIEFGQWEGKRVEEIANTKEYLNLKTQPHLYNPSSFDGETYLELVTRARNALQRIIEKTPDNETLLIVAHGVVLTSLIKSLQNYPIKDYRKDGLLDNTTINHIVTNDQGKSFKVIAYNQ